MSGLVVTSWADIPAGFFAHDVETVVHDRSVLPTKTHAPVSQTSATETAADTSATPVGEFVVANDADGADGDKTSTSERVNAGLLFLHAFYSRWFEANPGREASLEGALTTVGVARPLVVTGSGCESPRGTVLAGSSCLGPLQSTDALVDVVYRHGLTAAQEEATIVSDLVECQLAPRMAPRKAAEFEQLLRTKYAGRIGRPSRNTAEISGVSVKGDGRDIIAHQAGATRNAVEDRRVIFYSPVGPVRAQNDVDSGALRPSRVAAAVRAAEQEPDVKEALAHAEEQGLSADTVRDLPAVRAARERVENEVYGPRAARAPSSDGTVATTSGKKGVGDAKTQQVVTTTTDPCPVASAAGTPPSDAGTVVPAAPASSAPADATDLVAQAVSTITEAARLLRDAHPGVPATILSRMIADSVSHALGVHGGRLLTAPALVDQRDTVAAVNRAVEYVERRAPREYPELHALKKAVSLGARRLTDKDAERAQRLFVAVAEEIGDEEPFAWKPSAFSEMMDAFEAADISTGVAPPTATG